MHLDRVEPICEAFEQAGFSQVTSRSLPELADEATGNAVPYLIAAVE